MFLHISTFLHTFSRLSLINYMPLTRHWLTYDLWAEILTQYFLIREKPGWIKSEAHLIPHPVSQSGRPATYQSTSIGAGDAASATAVYQRENSTSPCSCAILANKARKPMCLA